MAILFDDAHEQERGRQDACATYFRGREESCDDQGGNRYLINSPMLPQIKKSADGSIMLYIQKDSPGAGNWQPPSVEVAK